MISNSKRAEQQLFELMSACHFFAEDRVHKEKAESGKKGISIVI